MILSFTLSMPNVGSWNGKWTGADRLHVRTRRYKGKAANENAKSMIGSYRYDFGDGWAARVTVKQVDGKESTKLKRKSEGFYGYDWMIKSIETHGKIIVEDE